MWLPPPDDDAAWLAYLCRQQDLVRPIYQRLDDEYEGRSRIHYMQPELARELGDRLTQVVLAWPQLVVDALDERLDVEGFRLPDAAGADDEMWRIWQANDLDTESGRGHVDALTLGRSYLCVGAGDDPNTPIITVESAFEVHAVHDPRTRQVVGAVRRWYDNPWDPTQDRTPFATLYLPNRTVYYVQDEEIDRDEHGLGVVPVISLVNRGRLNDRRGRSELEPILPLAHAANKILTDMMVAAEFVALPMRGIFGASPADFVDESGKTLSALQVLMGRMLAIPGVAGEMREFQFPAADMGGFHATVRLLASMVASLAGLPQHMVGLVGDNPPSADAIRADEARLVKRAERRQRAFDPSYESAMRLARRIQTGAWDPALQRLETVWRDPATPTVAQRADAAVKLRAAGIVSTRQTRVDLGYTDPEIRRMEADDQGEADMLMGAKPPTPPPVPAPPPMPPM